MSHFPYSHSQSFAPPLTLVVSMWRDAFFLVCVKRMAAGGVRLLILLQIIETGIWRKLWLSICLTCFATINLARLHSAERKAPSLGNQTK